jgi:hypothetical protein
MSGYDDRCRKPRVRQPDKEPPLKIPGDADADYGKGVTDDLGINIKEKEFA